MRFHVECSLQHCISYSPRCFPFCHLYDPISSNRWQRDGIFVSLGLWACYSLVVILVNSLCASVCVFAARNVLHTTIFTSQYDNQMMMLANRSGLSFRFAIVCHLLWQHFDLWMLGGSVYKVSITYAIGENKEWKVELRNKNESRLWWVHRKRSNKMSSKRRQCSRELAALSDTVKEKKFRIALSYEYNRKRV